MNIINSNILLHRIRAKERPSPVNNSFQNNYPKIAHLGFDFLKDTNIFCNLIFGNQPVTIMQEVLHRRRPKSGKL